MNVWTGGTFDLLHPGHIHLLRECFWLGHVTVAVNTDEFVGKFKAPPVQKLHQRLAMVQAVRYVDRVQENPGGDAQPGLILQAGAKLIVIGDDWKDRDYLSQLCISEDWLEEHDIRVRYIPRISGYSTTELKAQVRG